MILRSNKFDEDKNKKDQIGKEELEQNLTNSEYEEKISFFERLKTDKKFSAKTELLIYGIVVLIIIVAFNTNNNYTNTTKNDINTNNNNVKEEIPIDLYKELENNYKASITITSIKDGVVTNLSYNIERTNTNNEIKENITKIDDEITTKYSKTDTGEFYVVNSDSTLELVEENTIFNLIPYKYLNSDNLKKYISKGITEYTTNYSNGNKLISYKIMLKDLLLDVTNEEYITINVTTQNKTLIMDIDYTNLLKNDTIDSCNIKIVYTNINENITTE